VIKAPFLSGSTSNITKRSLLPNSIKNLNQSECCPCNTLLNGNINDKRAWSLCQDWLTNFSEVEARKATVIDEVSFHFMFKTKIHLYFHSGI
jgi:hypothetical protein